MSLRPFLSAAKRALTRSSEPLTVVVGNESADLDSLCSAVVYAFLRTKESPVGGAPYIPLSNLYRRDLPLRPELTAVLKYANLKPTDLLTLDDLPRDMDHFDWILVDHNSLTGPLAAYQDRVVGCVDHHVDEGNLPKGCDPRVLKTCGSCSSLILNECRVTWETLEAEDKQDLAYLGLAPVLIDTGNLLVKDKVTTRDVTSAAIYSAALPAKFYAPRYYDEINEKKEDLGSMTPLDVMRKDYKEWEENGVRLGTIGSPRGLSYLIKHAGSAAEFVKAFKEFTTTKEVDIMAAMCIITTEGKFGRDLMLSGATDKGKHVMTEFLGKHSGSLQLNKFDDGSLDSEDGYRMAWKQGDATSGRKQIAPLLRDIMKTVK